MHVTKGSSEKNTLLQSVLRRVVLRATVYTIQWCRSGTPAPRFTVDADNFIVNFYNVLGM